MNLYLYLLIIQIIITMLPSIRLTYSLLILFVFLRICTTFQFRQLQVTVLSHTTIRATTYHILFNRTITNDLISTSWSTSPLSYNSSVVITFPPAYAFSSAIVCSYLINSSSQPLPSICSVTQNRIKLKHPFVNETYLATLTVIIENIVSPSYNAIEECFLGQIGEDMAICKEKPSNSLSEVGRWQNQQIRSTNDDVRGLQILGMSGGNIEASFNQTNATRVSYNFSFILGNNFSSNGYVTVSLPSSIWAEMGYGNCYSYISTTSQQIQCLIEYASSHYTITFLNINSNPNSDIMAGTAVTLRIANGLINPPTTGSVTFKISVYASTSGYVQSQDINYSSYAPNSFSYSSIHSSSPQNGASANYTVMFLPKTMIPRYTLIYIEFPVLLLQTTSTCLSTISSNLSSINVTVEKIGNIFKIITLADTNATMITLNCLNFYNPFSFEPFSGFILSMKTPDDVYFYAYSELRNLTSNSVPSIFKKTDYSIIQTITSSLPFVFQPSQMKLKPSYVIFAYSSVNSFVSEMNCSEFKNWTGFCTDMGNFTLKITGNFSDGDIGLTINLKSGYFPAGLLTLSSYSAAGYKIDEISQNLVFHTCSITCKTCLYYQTTCTACHSSVLISNYLYFYSPNSSCLASCPLRTYANSLNTCTSCDSRCLTCFSNGIFCTSCQANSSYPYLSFASPIHTCVANCETGQENNGTHCIATSSTSVSFSLSSLIFSTSGLLIALISPIGWVLNKRMLVFVTTNSLMGLLQGAFLIRFSILMSELSDPSLWHGTIQCLVLAILLNIATVTFLVKSFSNQAEFKQWYEFNLNKVVHALVTIISCLMSHKFLGLLFSGCCGLKVFSLFLKDPQLPIFTLSSLFSMVLSANLIFLTATALSETLDSELRGCCIDGILLFSHSIIFCCLSLSKARGEIEVKMNNLVDSTAMKIGENKEKQQPHSHYQMEIQSRA